MNSLGTCGVAACLTGEVEVNGQCRTCNNQWPFTANLADPENDDLCWACTYERGITTCTTCMAGYLKIDT